MSVECEFKNIESLINCAINSTTKANGSLDALLAKTRKAVAEERGLIKKQFPIHALSLGDRQQTEGFVRYHQHYLITLIDELFDLSQTITKRNSKNGSSLKLELFFFYDQLTDILDFIRQRFSEYFNQKVKLPEPEKIKFLKEVNRKHSFVKTLFEKRSVNQTLARVCSHPIIKANDPLSVITYEKAFFINTLIQELQQTMESVSEEDINDCLRSLLTHLDYNDENYFRYYLDFIKSGMPEIESHTDQLERLALHFKIISQSHSKNGIIYDDTVPPIREQLMEWILDEIQYLEKKLRLNTLSLIKEDDFAKADFKIEFDISVSQLACLIKVFIEAGIIQNKNISELIRFLSKFAKTKRSESISNESFRIKYYNVESGTKQSVRNLFHTAISFINSN